MPMDVGNRHQRVHKVKQRYQTRCMLRGLPWITYYNVRHEFNRAYGSQWSAARNAARLAMVYLTGCCAANNGQLNKLKQWSKYCCGHKVTALTLTEKNGSCHHFFMIRGSRFIVHDLSCMNE